MITIKRENCITKFNGSGCVVELIKTVFHEKTQNVGIYADTSDDGNELFGITIEIGSKTWYVTHEHVTHLEEGYEISMYLEADATKLVNELRSLRDNILQTADDENFEIEV